MLQLSRAAERDGVRAMENAQSASIAWGTQPQFCVKKSPDMDYSVHSPAEVPPLGTTEYVINISSSAKLPLMGLRGGSRGFRSGLIRI